MSIPFRLLQVPTVVMTEILKMVRIEELITLSMCSKRIRLLVKLVRSKSKNWKIVVAGQIKGGALVALKREKAMFSVLLAAPKIDPYPFEDPREVVKIGDSMVPIAFGQKVHLKTFWENLKDGIKAIIDFITDVFNSPVHVLVVRSNDIWISDYINSRQGQELETGHIEHIEGVPINDEEFENVLTNFHATKRLYLRLLASTDFRYNGNMPKVNHISIVFGQWITLDNLKAIDSIVISVQNLKITTTDFIGFMRYWMTGGCERMKFTSFEIEGLDEQKIKENLKGVQIDEMRGYKMYAVDKPDGKLRRITSGYDVCREGDDAKATIDFTHSRYITIAVWPDTDNNCLLQ